MYGVVHKKRRKVLSQHHLRLITRSPTFRTPETYGRALGSAWRPAARGGGMELSHFGTASVQGDAGRGATRQGRLVAAADVALRATLGPTLHAPYCDGEVAGPRLRRAVRSLCDDARRDGAQAEDVLIAVKQAWASLPELT